LAGGATFAELTKGTFKNIEILTPPEHLVTKFAHIESPLFKKIETLLAANRKLVKTRDLLLPCLISGKLAVDNLDIQFPPGMMGELHHDSDLPHHA
jgi:type I restriction enzyme S subunit